MQETEYILNVFTGHGGIVTKRFTVRVPSHIDLGAPTREDMATFKRSLMERHLRLLLQQEGPFFCVICGKMGSLYKSTSLYFTTCIVDNVSCTCGGGCEDAALAYRRKMTTDMIKELEHPEDGTSPCFTAAKWCLNCGQTDNISCCARCKQASYCSRKCQKMDWPRHKVDCQARSQTGSP